MTTTEFSNEFDILYNNIASNGAPSLDEYEKSVFLTRAQDDIIKAYFNPKTNKVQEGFDGSEKRQIDFSMLIRSDKLESDKFNSVGVNTFDPRAISGTLIDTGKSNRILMFLNEYVVVERNEQGGDQERILTVVPIDYSTYTKLMCKPFKYPTKHLAWRIINTSMNPDAGNPFKVELILGPHDNFVSYNYRYIRKPNPIILSNLEDTGLSIDGLEVAQSCILDEILHKEILQRAVELAKSAYIGDLNSTIALGTSSLTNMGIVAAPQNNR